LLRLRRGYGSLAGTLGASARALTQINLVRGTYHRLSCTTKGIRGIIVENQGRGTIIHLISDIPQQAHVVSH
jgi:hypothetical protein